MANDKIFVDGLIAKKHNFSNGGSITKLSFKVEEIKAFLDKHANNGWVNVNICSSQKDENKLYAELDTWKPDGQAPKKGEKGNPITPADEVNIDDLPFSQS